MQNNLNENGGNSVFCGKSPIPAALPIHVPLGALLTSRGSGYHKERGEVPKEKDKSMAGGGTWSVIFFKEVSRLCER
jgi:hypothetical protein